MNDPDEKAEKDRSPVDQPEAAVGATGLPVHPDCPFCSTAETELFSAFGSQLSVSTYWCRRCRSPFEYMKWGGASWKGEGQPPVEGS